MNTTIAILLTIVVTNWTHIGDFKDTSGKSFDVQQGRLQTNTVAQVQWYEEHFDRLVTNRLAPVLRWKEKHTNEFILKSIDGPIIGERRIELTNAWFGYATNLQYIPFYSHPMFTNKIILN